MAKHLTGMWPASTKCGRHLSDFHTSVHQTSTNTWSKTTGVGRHVVDVGQLSVEVVQGWPIWAQVLLVLAILRQKDGTNRPNLARVGPRSTNFGRPLPKCHHHRPHDDHIVSLWAKSWSTFGQCWSNFGRLRPTSVFEPIPAKFGQACFIHQSVNRGCSGRARRAGFRS